MKTCELTGAALDWAVCKCFPNASGMMRQIIARPQSYIAQYSTNWSQGGPIIEREVISVTHERPDGWLAETDPDHNDQSETGPTPLIAAMRCYVASKLGEEVEIPEELK